MLVGKKVPFVYDQIMKEALKTLNSKHLGLLWPLITRVKLLEYLLMNLKRLIQKKHKIDNSKIKAHNKNPFCGRNTLTILKQMNKKQITNVCVFKKGNKRKTVGVIHIRSIKFKIINEKINSIIHFFNTDYNIIVILL